MSLTRLALTLLTTAAIAHAQFEVASIKRNTSGDSGETFTFDPGRFNARNIRLRALIQEAWSLMDFQISGGPHWIDTDRFDIAAKSEGNLTYQTVLPLLRPLLEERFALKVHTETREESAYMLTVAKSGMKIQHAEGTCIPRDPTKPPPQPAPNYCGNMRRNNDMLEGQGEPISDTIGFTFGTLCGQLSSILGRAVIDKTGLAGIYNFHLQWTPDLDTPTDTSAPSIFTAVQEQLGLKLESAKGPVEVLVIDHVESPSEN